MHYAFRPVLSFLLLALGMTPLCFAQDASPVFSVAYIEVKPSLTEQAMDLLKAHADESRAQDGNLRFQLLQRTGRSNHFAILDAWESREQQDEHTATTKSFREELDAMLYSPYDERKSTPAYGTSALGGEGDVYVLTHVDFSPRNLDAGLDVIEALIVKSRQEVGARDFGVIVQDDRQNHMTLFEVWSSTEAHDAHVISEHALRARNQIQALMGALYDERLYRRL